MPRRGATAIVFYAALSMLGCAPRSALCSAPATCGAGHVCAAGRCTRAGSLPIAPDAFRLVVAASDLAVVSPRSQKDTLPDEFALFGRPASVLLLRFPAPWGNRARIVAAFLTLNPPESPLGNGGQAWTLSVARILESWSGASVTWGRLPRCSAPLVSAEVLPSVPRPLRIDVTPIVQRWSQGEGDDQGIALFGSSAAALGPTYATGTLGLAGPRLDVYVR